ncbi:hypothetical protein [Vibrio hippocampi]|uniref:Uncharacterized protein n=1 Tax=Vibrio hippocampi TaxID=654686 RepID=A0ABN8DFN1_9VIBR|nr:hypothetical protein [Vibrio hippocampi]CAH0526098.1 hypothetical protein VHP8226_01580 [Vibrio hippocampi]
MLQQRLDRINELRKQALSNPEFVESAKAHEQALNKEVSQQQTHNKKPKSLSEIYQGYQFGNDTH